MIEPDVVADVTLVGVREGWDYIVMGPGQAVGVERRYGEVLDAHRLSKERFPFLPGMMLGRLAPWRSCRRGRSRSCSPISRSRRAFGSRSPTR